MLASTFQLLDSKSDISGRAKVIAAAKFFESERAVVLAIKKGTV